MLAEARRYQKPGTKTGIFECRILSAGTSTNSNTGNSNNGRDANAKLITFNFKNYYL